MFIRRRTVFSSSGRKHTYLELVRSYRKNGKVGQERLCSLGRLDELRESGNIDRLIAGLAKVAKEDWVRKEAV